ncbi:MAG: hypothetical protein HY075_05965 [Deltaproteobacteria bacterium]|nr:hypothetical protein [Deltaproteobacteria bacterium]
MKTASTLILLLLPIAIAGCASAKKQPTTDTANAATPAKAEQAAAPATAAADADKITCTQDTENRVLAVVKKGAGCALEYTKEGKTSTPSTSQHGLEHCKATQKKIRAKLEAAGYKCS